MASLGILPVAALRTVLAAGLAWALTVPAAAQGDFQKGISYYKQGQYRKAVEEFEQLVKASPDYEAGYRVLGDSYLKLKEYAKAAAAFQKAAELDGSRFASHLGAAVALFNLGRYQEAISVLDRGEAAAKSPRERYQLHQLRGSAWYKLNRFPEAAAELGRAVGIQRGDFNDVLQLGVSLYQVGKLADARQYLEQALSLKPDSAEALRFLRRVDFGEAVAAIEARQYPRAVELLRRVVGDDPSNAEAWYNLGLAQMFSDQLAAAEASFKRCAELRPAGWEAHHRLGYIYEKSERYQEALRSYSKALELHPDPAVAESVKRVEERLRRQRG